MRVPVSWLRDYVPIEMPLARARRAGSRSRRPRSRGSKRGASPTSPATWRCSGSAGSSRPRSTRTPTGCRSRGSTSARPSRARSSAAPGTSASVRPSASRCRARVLPNGLALERRKVRGEVSDGMILAEDEVGLGPDHAGIMLLPAAEPGTPLAEVLPLVDEVLARRGDRQPSRPAVGLRPRARDRDPLRPAARTAARGCAGAEPPSEPVAIRIDDLRGCPRYVGRLFEDVTIAPSPQWLRTRLHLAGQRPISNVVDVTNYVMLALGNPLHAFDFRTLRGGEIVVRCAGAGRAADDARRRRPHARRRRPRDRRRRTGRRARRDHGRRGDRDRRGDDVRPARGGELRAVRHLPHLGAAAAAHRGLEPLGEGSRPLPRRAGGRPRDRAAARARRRQAGRRASDVHGELPGAAADPLPPRARRRADRRRDAARPSVRAARAARLRAPRRRGRRPDLARARRHARGRRDRGGRALPARGRPVHAAGSARDVRPPHPRPAAAPPRRGRARRARLRRDLHAEPAPGRRDALEAARADLGRADGAPHLAAAEPRRGGAPKPRRRRAADRALRDRARLPAGRRAPGGASPTVAAIAEGGFLHVKGVVEALYRGAEGGADLRPRQPSAPPSGEGRAHRRRRPRRAPPARARQASGAPSSSTSAGSSRPPAGR